MLIHGRPGNERQVIKCDIHVPFRGRYAAPGVFRPIKAELLEHRPNGDLEAQHAHGLAQAAPCPLPKGQIGAGVTGLGFLGGVPKWVKSRWVGPEFGIVMDRGDIDRHVGQCRDGVRPELLLFV